MANKQERLRGIEREIVALNPDPQDCVALVHAIQASLKLQHGDQAVDAQEALTEACVALDELDSTLMATAAAGAGDREDFAYADHVARTVLS